MEGRNQVEKRDIDRIEADLREATAISNKFYADIQRLKEAITNRDLELRGLKLRLETLEAELEQAQRRIAFLTDSIGQKDADIATITSKLNHENLQINATKAALAKLEQEIKYFDALNQKHIQAQNSLQKMCDQEYYRGKELANLENDRRITLKLREDEISALKGEIDHFKHIIAKLVDDQYEFQNEIEALKRHVALLNQQNFEVSPIRDDDCL